MPTYNKKPDLFDTEEGQKIMQSLKEMAKDSAYNTESSYIANTTLYPDNLIHFVDKHMAYLRTHPSVNPEHYISNLRLMTRVR